MDFMNTKAHDKWMLLRLLYYSFNFYYAAAIDFLERNKRFFSYLDKDEFYLQTSSSGREKEQENQSGK